MEANSFKSVTFGGFDKQDVIHYIEKTSQEHAEALSQLQHEADSLRQERDSLSQQAAQLTEQLSQQAAQLTEQLTQLRQELEQTQAEQAAQVEALRPDAEAYRQFRTRIGDIECEARTRAAELEHSTHAQLRKTAESFRVKYQTLTDTFATAAAYTTAELRKVEVNLSQLPRALDQVGADLDALDETLKDKPE